MPSTYSSSLRLELQATGENANTWGTKTNNNLNLLQQAIAGYTQITLTSASATYALDITDGAASDGRNAFIKFVGTVASAISITVPDVAKGYWVKNSATGSPLTFRTSSGTGFTLPTNEWVFAISDGASVVNSTPTSLVGYARLSATQVFTGGNTFASAVTISGAASLASTLVVGGNSTLNGNVSVSGTFTAKSATSLASTLVVNGGATFNSNVSVSGTFGVSGVATFSSIVNIRGNTSIAGNFLVSGVAEIRGATSLASTLVVNGTVTMNSIVSVAGTFVANSTATFRRPVSVSGSMYVTGNLGQTVLSDTLLELGRSQVFGQSEIFFYTSGTNYDANISRFVSYPYFQIADTFEINIDAPTVNINSRLGVTSVVQIGTGTRVGGSDQLVIFNGVAPVSSVANGIILYAEDVAASSELKVRDEAGNVTTLSPHNFELCGGPSEEMAWGYYSTRNGKAVNVDMMRALRLLEKLSGEKLIYIGDDS
jgi:predicted acyltransferase (DUF342 family)